MKIGYCFTGSYCTFDRSLRAFRELLEAGHKLQPIMSENAFSTDTRFFEAEAFKEKIREICDLPIIHSVKDAEPLGPRDPMDILIISPCTGNTLAKIASGITDTAVTMAAKAHLRCDRPLLIALASNDALSQNLKNIAALLARKAVYFLPMHQDDPVNKPHSLIADFERMKDGVDSALSGIQLRPVFL